MNPAFLSSSLREAQNLAEIQPSSGPRIQPLQFQMQNEPGYQNSQRISPADLRVLRDKFPQLSEFSEEFLQSRTLEELLRIESTCVRSKDSERAKEADEKLASNKAALASKFYEVPAGRDNRWSELHPARFMPGVACSATKEFMVAREVIGLTSPPAVGCYDMTSVGMGGFVTAKGWMEMANTGSTKMRVGMFNLNNAAKSYNSKGEDDMSEMKDISEFILALRTMRCAAQFAQSWNKSYMALDNFLFSKDYCKEELKHDSQPGKTLCMFTDFVLSENANHWRDGSGFLTTGELQAYWDSFIGARPQSKPKPSTQASTSAQAQQAGPSQGQNKQKKKKFPFVDICPKWNVGKCNKPAGTCYTFNGVVLRHVCNWRDLNVPNSQPCAAAHTRRGNH
jgi:hypothetical protein